MVTRASGRGSAYDERMPAKRARRSELRARRRAIAAARDLPADGRRIAALALGEVNRRGARAGGPQSPGRTVGASPVTITLYEPLPVEPDVSALLRDAYRSGVRVLVPITLPDLDLDWAQWSPEGLGEPLGAEAISQVTVAFVPGLSVDADGTRMGQGGGCYDKALPRVRSGAPVICILHPGEDLTEPALPREPHDVPVDAVLTADGIRWVD